MPRVSCGFLGAAPAPILLTYHGPVIKVDLGFDKKYKSPGKPPVHFRKGLEALVDTGARESCIDGLSHPIVLGRSFLAYVRLVYDGPTGDAEVIREP